MLRKAFFNFLFLLFAVSLMNGCYTVVMHQKNSVLPVEEETAYEPENYSHSIDISNQSSCASCHSDDVAYNEIGAAGSIFGSSSMWAYYYDTNIPWWISRGKLDESAGDSLTELGDTGMRRYYGRRREALNNDNASSSITTTTGVTNGGAATIPSFPLSTPTFGGTITTTVTTDSVKTQDPDSTQTVQVPAKSESQNKKREYGTRKSTKKK